MGKGAAARAASVASSLRGSKRNGLGGLRFQFLTKSDRQMARRRRSWQRSRTASLGCPQPVPSWPAPPPAPFVGRSKFATNRGTAGSGGGGGGGGSIFGG